MSYPVMQKLKDFQEDFTSAVKTIKTDHAYIYDGFGFAPEIDMASLAAETTVNYQFQTPSSAAVHKYIHLKSIHISCEDASMKMAFHKATSTAPINVGTSGSNTVNIFNLNDNSTYSSGTAIKYTGVAFTSNDDGVQWISEIAHATTAKRQGISGVFKADPNEEIVLQPATTYIIKFINLSTGTAATNIHGRAFFYEEENG